MKYFVSTAFLALVSGVAFAGEVVSLPDAVSSVGSAALANSLSASDVTFSALGGYTATRVRVTFSVTQINGTTDDYLSENRLRLWRTGASVGDAATITLQPAGNGYSGTRTVSAFGYLSGGAAADPAGTWGYRFYNALDDAPTGQPDSSLTNISLEYNFSVVTPSAVSLGSILPGPNLVFDTEHTVITGGNDTEIGVYSSEGRFLGTDDDSGTGNLSSLSLAGLPADTYYIAVAGYNASFADGFAVATNSTATGDISVNVSNGIDTVSGGGRLDAGQVQWYVVTVPTPGSIGLLATAGLVAFRRRR